MEDWRPIDSKVLQSPTQVYKTRRGWLRNYKSKKEKHIMAGRSMRVMAVVLGLLATTAIAKDRLFNGESLEVGQHLENGPYRFIMQGDCNLVLYVNGNRPLWSSKTDGKGGSCRATLQDNGNLVIFSGSDVVWTSGSSVGPNSYRLVVQGDGNVVIYGAALWATNTTVQSRRLLR